MTPSTAHPLSNYYVTVTDHNQDGQPVGNHQWQGGRVPEFHACLNDECKTSRDDKSPYKHPLESLVRTMIDRNETERWENCGGGIDWAPRKAGLSKPLKRCKCHITIQITLPAPPPAVAQGASTATP